MLATLISRAQFGMDAPEVIVDVHVGPGLPAMAIVGLPETAVKESRDRVRSAIITAQLSFPAGRITVNLAPADLPKDGGRFDLPIAIGLLIASGQLTGTAVADCELYGELSLGGEIRAVRGVLPATRAATEHNRRVILPRQNLEEAQLVQGARIAPVRHLSEVVAYLRGLKSLEFVTDRRVLPVQKSNPDLADVRGQHHPRRALEIAAAGRHSVLLVGSPGTGNSMLAKRLPGILPPLSDQEALEVATIASAAGQRFRAENWRCRPFRSPHHTCTSVALVGGGSLPKPGEITLAHNGVLFLDELPEFDRIALEGLREPLENGCITVSRAAHHTDYPARFQLIAAMNPCPCGFLADATARCRCTLAQIQRYHGRISGPLLDRLDLHVAMENVGPAQLLVSEERPERSAAVAARVQVARKIQEGRQQMCNANLDNAGVERHCRVTPEGVEILELALQRFGLSVRAYHRVLKVARTVADLDGSDCITGAHISEALLFRQLDQLNWGGRVDRSYAGGKAPSDQSPVRH